jgi:hypothetical protein
MALIKCPDCSKDVSDKAAACPHCGSPLAQTLTQAAPASSQTAPSQPQPQGCSPIVLFGGLFLAGAFAFTIYGLIQMERTKTSTSPPSASPPTQPSRPKQVQKPKPIELTPDLEKKLTEAIVKCRQKRDAALKVSMMDKDLAAQDKYSFDNGRVSVTLRFRLLSQDARTSFADGSLRKQVYANLKMIYESTLAEYGFDKVIITSFTDF